MFEVREFLDSRKVQTQDWRLFVVLEHNLEQCSSGQHGGNVPVFFTIIQSN